MRASASKWTPPPLTLTSRTTLVESRVVVRGRNGHVVAGLGRADFRIYDDGELQPLVSFSVNHAITAAAPRPAPPAAPGKPAPPAAVASAPPRFIALYFDDVKTSAADFTRARAAAVRFLRAPLGPGDRVCVFTASSTQSLGCSRDRAKLDATIAAMRVHPRGGGADLPCPKISSYEAAQIAEYHNSIIMAAVADEAQHCRPTMLFDLQADVEAEFDQARGVSYDLLRSLQDVIGYLARQGGQRDLIFTSDGFIDDDLNNELGTIRDLALRDGVVVNALDARGLYTMDAMPAQDAGDYTGFLSAQTLMTLRGDREMAELDKEDAMAYLARKTGGLFFRGDNDLALGYAELAHPPAVTYSLGFNMPARDGKFHKIAVRLVPHVPGASIETRQGYFAPSPGPTVAEFMAAMDNAMRATGALSGVAARVGFAAAPGAGTVEVRFNAARLPFLHAHGRRDQRLFVIAALYTASGACVAGKMGELDLALKKVTLKRFIARGLFARLALRAAPGRYRLRVVVGEASDAKLSAFTGTVRIP